VLGEYSASSLSWTIKYKYFQSRIQYINEQINYSFNILALLK